MAFNVSFFSNLQDTYAQLRVGLDWQGLLEALGGHRPLLSKDAAPLFSPCEWHPGHGPSKDEGARHAVGVHFGSFDFDDLHELDVPRVLGALEASQIAHAIISSFSHSGRRKHADSHYKAKDGSLIPAKPGPYYQLRVLFPFTRLVAPSEWKAFWNAANTRIFAGLADTVCKSFAHRYYVPCYREGSGVAPIYAIRPGTALDIDAFMQTVVTPKTETAQAAAAGRSDIEASDLRRIARALKGSKAKKELGEALALIAEGEPYASKGHRHGVTYRLVREILDRHPNADHERLASLFGPSLALMQPTHITQDVIVGMCTHKEPSAKAVDHTSRIAEAFNGARGDAYDAEDVTAMAETLGCRNDELVRRWIVQHGSSYYLLCDGVYRHYSYSDVLSAAVRDLAPAAAVGVDLHELTKSGMRRKTIQELMDSYGCVANSVVVDLAAQRASYDAVTRTFIEAPCPIRVTAKYHEGVDRWLRLLAGDKYEKLNDWLACVTSLDEPCAALYLEGERGTGKSLLAHGIAKIFADRPTTMKEAMGPFNESIVNCPVIFGDEQVPEDARGQIRTDEIREFIQARTRPLSRKYKPHATVKGALRLILAANNKDLLSTKEHLTQADLDALVERVLFLPVRREARDFINSQKASKWVEEDHIARHTMWLVENWEVERTGRFLVSGDSAELVQMLSTNTGLRSSVCLWVCGLLSSHQKFFNQYAKDRTVIAEGGRLLVTSKAIYEAWTMYLQDKGTPPSPNAIGRALAGLSKEVFVHDGPGKRTKRMRDFDLEALARWGRDTQYIDEDGIRDAVASIEKDQTMQMPGVRISTN